jgi:hypothetical protein
VAPAADWNLSEEDIRLIEVWLKEREEKIKNLGVII